MGWLDVGSGDMGWLGIMLGLFSSLIGGAIGYYLWSIMLSSPSLDGFPSPLQVYHRWTLKTQGRPNAIELEKAIKEVMHRNPKKHQAWVSVFDRLEKKRTISFHSLTATLLRNDQDKRWGEHFIVRYLLELRAAEAGELVEVLRQIGTTADDNSSMPKYTAIWLLSSIGEHTKGRWGQHFSDLLCPKCFVRCYLHTVELQGKTIKYYGCRTCQQSQNFLNCNKIVAVLNNQLMEEYSSENGIFRINWSVKRTLFDFDEIEIISATDEDVERFVVQVGNDTDVVRRTTYENMRCTISSGCQLPENSMRILKRVFGQIEISDKAITPMKYAT